MPWRRTRRHDCLLGDRCQEETTHDKTARRQLLMYGKANHAPAREPSWWSRLWRNRQTTQEGTMPEKTTQQKTMREERNHVAEMFPLHVTPGSGLPFKLWRTGSEGGVNIPKMNTYINHTLY